MATNPRPQPAQAGFAIGGAPLGAGASGGPPAHTPVAIATTAPGGTQLPTARLWYASFTRIDAKQRLVEVIATSEAVDSFGTRFSFEASVDAFTRALGNVREMHQDIAAGSIKSWIADAKKRLITAWIYVSEGAESTWQKILDGTLKGASIGADKVQWAMGADGIPIATSYDLAELSFVDNPSNPDARILAVRYHPPEGTTGLLRSPGSLPATRAQSYPPARHQVAQIGGHMPTKALRTLEAAAQRAGQLPNSLTNAPTNPADVMQSANSNSMGHLIVNTSSDPHAPDYGVPPLVTVTDTRGNAGTDSFLSGNDANAGIFPGGHAPGITVQQGMNPMPETQGISGIDEQHPTVDNTQPTPVTYPTGTQPMALGGGEMANPVQGTATPPPVRSRAQQQYRITPTGDGRFILTPVAITRDDGGPGAVVDTGAIDVSGAVDTSGNAPADSSGGAATGTGNATAAVSPQWHRVRRSAVNHAMDVTNGCGCPGCAALSRAMRDAMQAADSADAGTPQSASMARQPTETRGQTQVIAQIASVLAALTERVEAIGATPQPGGPLAYQTRGYSQMQPTQKIQVLQDLARRSQDPNVQMEAAAAIIEMQRG